MSESRIAYASKNVLFGLLGKALLIVLEFVARAVFIKFLGEELLGINGVFANVIQILSLAELGMNNVVNYSFYKPIAENDYDKIGKLINYYKKVYNAIALVVLFIGLLLIPFLDVIINTSIQLDNVILIYLIFVVDTVFSYLFIYKSTLLRAAQRGYVITQYEMISNITRVILQILVMCFLQNIIVYLIIKVLASVLTNAVCAKRAEEDYPCIRSCTGELNKNEQKDIFDTIKSGFVYKIAGVLLNSTDNILISTMIGTVWVGYLANYLTIMNGISSFYTVIFSSLTASIGNLVVLESKEKKLEIFEIMLFVSSWLAVVFSVCLYVLSGEFVILWIGEKYVLDKSVVLAKVLMLFLSCWLQPLFCYREAVGLYRKTKYVMLIAAVINIILSIIMGTAFGLAGILYASIIAMLLTYLWYEPVVLYKECFEISSKRYFKQRVVEIFYLIVAFVGFDWLGGLFRTETWIGWILKAIVIFTLINIYCFVLFHKSRGFIYIVEKLKEKLHI